ncbi:MAG: flagellar filament capping protein FliD [Planctomycetaceae bacterium]|nr:flagellar filament capping protein FliD [Planctomycetaceae bacterium]
MATGMSGVFSTIDTDALVSAAMATAQKPLTRLTTEKSTIQAQQKALADIESRLTDFRTLAASFSNISTLAGVTATSSDTKIATVSATSGVTGGSFQVTIDRMASADRLAQTVGTASSTALVGAGAFSYAYDGVTRTRITTAETTLEGLRDLINNDSSNPGVTASILNVSGTYHLVLAGKDNGASHAININDETTTIAGFDAADFTRTQAAQSARLRVDGFPAETWIERDNNTISDVIPGVTLSLVKAGDMTVTLSRRTDQLSQNLGNLKEIYNGLVTTLNKYAGFDSETKVVGILQGDIGVRDIVRNVRSVLTSAAPGFSDGDDTFAVASQLGLTFDRYGVLSLDQATLDDAVAADYSAVLKLLGAVSSGNSSNAAVQFTSASGSTTAGAYQVQVHFSDTGVVDSAVIRKSGETAWRNLTINGSVLSGASGTPEAGLELSAIWGGGGAGTQSSDVNIQQGLGGALENLLDNMLDPTDGTITGDKNRFDMRITNLDKQIALQQDRLTRKEAQLKAKYARMESMLAQLDSQRAAFSAFTTSQESQNKDN